MESLELPMPEDGDSSSAAYGLAARKARRRSGLSQASLARQLGVSTSLVSKLENGLLHPSSRVTRRYAELLKLDVPDGEISLRRIAGATNAARVASVQLPLSIPPSGDWVAGLLPEETLVDSGPPPTYHWDIAQTIDQLAYLTHNFYRYYGKFPPTIPRKLLRDLAPSRDRWVLDNYSGSGTTLVESACEGYQSVGIDISPLATLAAQVKTSSVSPQAVSEVCTAMLKSVDSQPHTPAGHLPPEPILTKWFTEESSHDLARLKSALLALPVGQERSFLTLAFFAIIRRVSNAFDGEVRPHVNLTKSGRQVIPAYTKKVSEMIERLVKFQSEIACKTPAVAITGDNRRLQDLLEWDKLKVGIVISHPPYLNCFDYVPVYKLEYAWAGGFAEVGECFDYNALRMSETRCWPATDPSIFDRYFRDLREAFGQVAGIIDRGTLCCVVLGDCTVKGEVVPVLDEFTGIMRDVGFQHERTILRSTHYGTGKYAYADRAEYHGHDARKRDGILVFRRR